MLPCIVLGRDEFTRYRCVERLVVALLRRVRLPVHLPVRLSASSSVYRSVCLPVRLSAGSSIHRPGPSAGPSVRQPVCLLVPPSTGPVRLPVRLSAGASIHWPGPSVCWCLHPLARSVCRSVCPSARLSAGSSIHWPGPSVRQPVCLLVPPSTGPSVYRSVCPLVSLSAGPSVRWSICLSIHWSAYPLACLSADPSIYPLVHQYAGPSIRRSICLARKRPARLFYVFFSIAIDRVILLCIICFPFILWPIYTSVYTM